MGCAALCAARSGCCSPRGPALPLLHAHPRTTNPCRAGPIEFHRNSLLHLTEAMRRTRRLCSTVIDTMGRELMVRGQWQANDQVRIAGRGRACSMRCVVRLLLPTPAAFAHAPPLAALAFPSLQGYPWVLGQNEVTVGQTITLTTRPDAVATKDLLPIM